MLEVMILVVCFVVLIWSSVTDIKTTEVPDWLTHTAIVFGFVLNGMQSWLGHSWAPLIASGVGFGACFVIGVVTYYGGMWGGGDAKILMALGSLVGMQFRLDTLLLSFALYFLLVGAAYGLVWSVAVAIRRRERFVPAYRAFVRTPFGLGIRAAGFGLMLAFGITALLLQDTQLRGITLVLAVFFPFIAHVMLFVKSVEQCMVRKAVPNELLEGDWVMKDVVVGTKTVFAANKTGIPQHKIDELKHLSEKHHITILVKDGIPFVPAFFIAFALAVLVGTPLAFLH